MPLPPDFPADRHFRANFSMLGEPVPAAQMLESADQLFGLDGADSLLAQYRAAPDGEADAQPDPELFRREVRRQLDQVLFQLARHDRNGTVIAACLIPAEPAPPPEVAAAVAAFVNETTVWLESIHGSAALLFWHPEAAARLQPAPLAEFLVSNRALAAAEQDLSREAERHERRRFRRRRRNRGRRQRQGKQ